MPTVTDTKGRKLEVEPLDLMREMDLLEAAGPMSEITKWMSIARAASMVRTIDDVPIPFPKTQIAIRKLVERVGTEGLTAVAESMSPDDAVDVAAAEKAALDIAKN